jgi:hypothetical protein
MISVDIAGKVVGCKILGLQRPQVTNDQNWKELGLPA